MRTLVIAAMTASALLGAAPAAIAQELPLVAGEIKKVDADAGKMTIRHDPIPNLDMDSMTMVFKAKDAEMLDTVKPGDRVQFSAERVNGQITVTRIKKSK